jgi:hypothetical protein
LPAHLPEAVLRSAGRHVSAEVGTDPCLASSRAFEGEAEAPPVSLAGDVVVDLLEADALEPRRGLTASRSSRRVPADRGRAVLSSEG